MRTANLSILISFTMVACIDSFNLHVEGTSKLLVVDGMITSNPGPYSVKLFWSPAVATTGDFSSVLTPVSGAHITILDDQGTSEALREGGGGLYQTSNGGIQGIEGRTYHIEIVTADGQTYSSSPEYLAPPGTIDSLYFEFKKSEAIVSGQPLEADGFNIYVNARGNELQSILRWNWTGTYKVLTHPELEYGRLIMPRPYAPAPCSGYICGDPTCLWVKQVSALCTCCVCFITERQPVPFLSDNLFTSGTFQKYKVAFIPFVPRNFLERYYLDVQQLTISTSTYQFWKLVQSQITGSANLFQPPIAKIKGNIVSASGAAALGIFSACGVAEKTIWIKHNDVPYPFENPLSREQCQALDVTATIQLPSFWN